MVIIRDLLFFLLGIILGILAAKNGLLAHLFIFYFVLIILILIIPFKDETQK